MQINILLIVLTLITTSCSSISSSKDYLMTKHKIKLAAHRGASDDAPENTMASVKLAWEQNSDAVEVDVHLTKDNHIVTLHDTNFKRTGGVNKVVTNSNWKEIKDIDVGSWKGKQWKGETAPLLKDVLKSIPDNKKLMIEIKGTNDLIISNLIKIIKETKTPINKIIVISFDHHIITKLKKVAPYFECYYITVYNASRADIPEIVARNENNVDRLIKKALKNKVDGIDFEFGTSVITPEIIAKVKSKGLKTIVWVSKKDDTLENLKQSEFSFIDYFTTNKPLWMRENHSF